MSPACPSPRVFLTRGCLIKMITLIWLQLFERPILSVLSLEISVVSQNLLVKKNMTKIVVDLIIRANPCGGDDEKNEGWNLSLLHGMTTRLTRVHMHVHVLRTFDIGRWNLRIWLVFFPLTTHVEDGYSSLFFPFSFFIMRREYLYCHTWKHVCMYMYNWARTDPLCRNREVDTKHIANSLRWLRCFTDTS